MRLLRFLTEDSALARQERRRRVERALTDGLRELSKILNKLADAVETQRLRRDGHEEAGHFLKREPPPKDQSSR